MPVPPRSANAVWSVAAVLLAACTASPRYAPVALDRPAVATSQGRISFTVVDEYGYALPGVRVNMSWEEPRFYRTSAFTNREGQVSFSGVPSIAEVSVHHPGGLFAETLHVPQSGMPDVRVMVNTLGGGERMRADERARLMGRRPDPTQ